MPNPPETEFVGDCHCGAIRVALHVRDGAALSPRRCGCGFCRRHGGLYVSTPDARLTVQVSDAAAVNRYQFGHRTAEFLVCRNCGVVPTVLSTIDGHLYGIVNANVLDPPLQMAEPPPVADYDAEEPAGRLARRKERWIGDVTVVEGVEGVEGADGAGDVAG